MGEARCSRARAARRRSPSAWRASSRARSATRCSSVWYHFAIMFEALFILTTVDAGTRVARFMLQDLLGNVVPAARPHELVSERPDLQRAWSSPAWGYFLYYGTLDPLGGINSLWPLFGIANQMLAAIALCVATTVLVKSGRARFAWVTGLPLVWLVAVTTAAAWEKLFSPDLRVGFLSHANDLAAQLAAGTLTGTAAAQAPTLIFNDRLDAALTLFFLITVWVLVVETVRICHASLVGPALPAPRRDAARAHAVGGGLSRWATRYKGLWAALARAHGRRRVRALPRSLAARACRAAPRRSTAPHSAARSSGASGKACGAAAERPSALSWRLARAPVARAAPPAGARVDGQPHPGGCPSSRRRRGLARPRPARRRRPRPPLVPRRPRLCTSSTGSSGKPRICRSVLSFSTTRLMRRFIGFRGFSDVERQGGPQADDAQNLVLAHAARDGAPARSVGAIRGQLPVRVAALAAARTARRRCGRLTRSRCRRRSVARRSLA